MASCHNCNNLLPRTVDRCPVCGVAPLPPEELEVETNTTPGWSSQPTGPEGTSPAQKAAAAGMPVESVRPPQLPQDRRPARVDPAVPAADAQGRGFTPPPLPDPTGLDPIGADSKAPVPQAWGGSAERLPPTTETGEQLDERSVKSMSSRIEGNIVIGKKANHAASIGVAVALGVTALGLGAWGGLVAQGDQAELAFSDESQSATGSDISASWFDDNAGAFVDIEVSGCDGVQSHRAIAVDTRTVLALASNIESDTTPTVTAADGIARPGRIVAMDSSRDLAVVRLQDTLPAHLVWGSTQRIVDQGVSVFPPDHRADDEALVRTVDDVVQRGNEVIGFTLDEPSPQGSVVIDSNGLLVGLVGAGQENAATAEALSAFVSEAVLNPDNPSRVCPPPPTTTTVQGDEGSETTAEN